MNRRRLPAPGPGRDWRALAAERPPCPPDPPADIELHLRRNGHDVPVVVLVAAVTITDPAELRTLATRLQSAADALEGGTP